MAVVARLQTSRVILPCINRLAAAEREAVLDAILTALWKGKLTREAAVGRIQAELGMSHHEARAEVDGFLRD